MNNYQSNNRNLEIVYFLHIPKTGGTTLRQFLEDQFHYDFILRPETWSELLKSKKTDLNNFRFIRGHFGISLNQILNQKPACLTMLRNPIERSISFFFII